MIDPSLPILMLLGVFCIVFVLLLFAPGMRRRALIALIAAVFMSPGIVVGHGIGITLALVVLLSGKVISGLVPMIVVWIIAFGVGTVVAFALRSRAATRPAPSLQACRRERFILAGSYAAVAVLIAASVSYRAYAREFKETYGPFVVTVDTGPRTLKDIVVTLNCMSPQYSGMALLESGKPHEFPRKHLPGLGMGFDCTVFVAHPDLALNIVNQYPLTDLAPRTPMTLPTIAAPLWTDARYQRIVRGEEIPPGSNDVPPLRRAEIAVYNDWGQLSTMWVPAFCGTEFERIQREYLPSLAARRSRVFEFAGTLPPQDDPAAIVLAGWKSTCDFYAAHPEMGLARD